MTDGPPSPPPPLQPPPVPPRAGDTGGGSSRGPLILVIAAVGALIAGIVGVLAILIAGGDDSTPTLTEASSTVAPTSTAPVSTTSTVVETTTSTEAPSPPSSDVSISISELSRAVVQLVTFDASGNSLWTGSGTIVESDGLILTNAHVVEQEPGNPYETLGVLISPDPASPPELQYLATVVSFEPELDLAVVSITADEDGAPIELDDLPTIPIGDSDEVELGDDIQVLGYPGIGGQTITFTRGSVSGFNAQAGVGNRAWIKTDATITGGNSGGAAINSDGELIGVPTLAAAGDVDEVTDCRFVQDTNGDNVIDSRDNCTPIGGFINGVRPINLAEETIENGRDGIVVEPTVTPPASVDVSNATLSNLTFSSGVDDDEPVDDVDLLPAGEDRVCAFWEYEGMTDGVLWDALWAVDGVQSEVGSIIGETWVGGEEGSWWVCFIAGEVGLAAGAYDLSVWIEGDEGISGNVVVGDQPRVDLLVENQTDDTICYLLLSPSSSLIWGGDDLGDDEVIVAGESTAVSVPAGDYDVQALTCDLDVVTELYEFDASQSTTIILEP